MGLFGFKKNAGPTCPYCGASVDAGDRFCINCGNEIPAGSAAYAGPAASRECPYCGAPLETGDVFCTHCGNRVDDGSAPIPAGPAFAASLPTSPAVPPVDPLSVAHGGGATAPSSFAPSTPVTPVPKAADIHWDAADPVAAAPGKLKTGLSTGMDATQGSLGLSYNVDIVMCIDATGSMRPILDTVKNNALRFYGDLTAQMEEKAKHINTLRVRVVAFRDYSYDGDESMLATNFFTLPAEAPRFEQLVRGIQAKGGGDKPEDGLEALAYAIRSDWTTEGDKRRHIIIVWTDDGTHRLGYSSKAPNYPSAMAKDFDELTEWWGDAGQEGVMDSNSKRLLIFAPEKQNWTDIEAIWDNVVFYPSIAGEGLQEVDYQSILAAICNSI